MISSKNSASRDSFQSPLSHVTESKVAVALISAVLGGLGTSIVTGLFTTARERREARSKAQQTFLTQQNSVVQEALVLVGRVRDASQGAIDADSELFADDKYAEVDRPGIREQRQTMRFSFNESYEEWGRSNARVGYMLSDYPFGQTEVMTAWRSVQASVDTLHRCVHDRARARKVRINPLPECSAPLDSVSKASQDLVAAGRLARTQAELRWEGTTSEMRDPESSTAGQK